MKTEQKVNLSLGLTLLAIIISIYTLTVGGFGQPKVQATGPNAFYLAQAKEAGIRTRTFETCLESPEIQTRINEEAAEAARLGGNGTPFNVIKTADNQLIPLAGAYPYEAFTEIIDRAIAGELTSEDLEGTPDYEDMRAFDPNRDYFKGSVDAEITIFEYSDYECPFCSRVHPTLQQVVDNYPNVNWVYRQLPLSFHPQAEPAARVALCIGQEKGNDAFWQFTDTLFQDQSVLQ